MLTARRLALLVFGFVFVFVIPVRARGNFTWIGQKVVLKYEPPIKVGDRIVPTHGFHVYKVRRVEGDRLWIASGSVEGWIPANQVVIFDRGIDFFTQEIKTNPAQCGGLAVSGILWGEKRDHDKAVADCTEAIRLDPEARQRLPQSRPRLEQQEAVRQGHRRLQRGHPARSQGCPHFHQPELRLGEQARLRQGRRRFQSGHRARSQVCRHADQQGLRLAEAKGVRQGDGRLRSGHPTRPQRCKQPPRRADAWRMQKQYDKAFADFDQAIRLDPSDPLSHTSRGDGWTERKEYEKAFADFNEAIRLDPSDPYPTRAGAWPG